jgi:hypothetical protein
MSPTLAEYGSNDPIILSSDTSGGTTDAIADSKVVQRIPNPLHS